MPSRRRLKPPAAAALAGVVLAGAAGPWLRKRRRPTGWAPPQGTVRQGALAVRTLGNRAGPAVVLLHGLAASHLYWGAAYDELANGSFLVVPDLLGFGSSPRPAIDYTVGAHAEALAAAVSDVGAQGPLLLVAHSTGCVAGLAFARLHPERVAGVVCFGPALYGNPQAARSHIAGLGLLTRLFAMDNRMAQAVCAWMCCLHPEVAARVAQILRPDLPASVARAGVHHSWASYAGTLRHLVLSAPAAAWLDQLEVPVHVVAGTKDRVVDREFLGQLGSTRRSFTVTWWAGAGHDAPLTDPSRCLAEIRSFQAHAPRPRPIGTTGAQR